MNTITLEPLTALKGREIVVHLTSGKVFKGTMISADHLAMVLQTENIVKIDPFHIEAIEFSENA